MATDTRCPEKGQLQALLDGDLGPEQEAALAEHLRNCETCRQRLDELTGKLGLLPEAAKADVLRQEPADEALQEMMANLRQQGPGDSGSGVPPAETVTAGHSAPPGEISLGFLDPPARPGCLGKLGGYDVTGVIGQGGMGVVLKGFDPALNRFVAIKVLAPQLASSGAARKRFSREAKNAAAISHDHVVTIHAVGEANAMPYLVMECIVGVSLEDRIRRTGPLKVEEILRIGMQAASGLAAAHAQGLVHRDIKPSNILLENGVERVKITDFGLARVAHEAEITQSGVVAGTPQYMSPEQARGEPIDRRSDLFSLGCVMYAMCTGRSPFRASTVVDAIRRVCDDTPRPIREINPEIPDWLAAIIDRLLAKKPEERFQTAAELAELLGKYLAHVQQPSQVALPTAPPVVAKEPTKPAGVPWRVVISAAACFAVIGLGILLWRLFPSSAEPRSRFGFVDLSSHANRGLGDGLGRNNPQNNLEQLEPGVLMVDGIPVQVDRRYIQLCGKWVSHYPAAARGIQVNRRAQTLHFLHGCAFAFAHGQTVATYTLRYEDGTTENLPVVIGRHLQEWWGGGWVPNVATRAKLAWSGRNPAAAKENRAIQLFLCSWPNPHPEKTIAAIDFERSPHEHPAPFCLGITCDDDPTPPPPEPGLLTVEIGKWAGVDRWSVVIPGCPSSPLKGWGVHHHVLLPPGRHQLEVRDENTVLRRGSITLAPGSREYVTVDIPTTLFPLPSSQPEPTAELIGQTVGVWDVALSRDGTVLATAAGDGTVVLWRLEHGVWTKRAVLQADVGLVAGVFGVVRSIAFSPNGAYLVTAGEGGTLKLWDVDSADLVATLEQGGSEPQSVAFSPGGTVVASGHMDGTLKFWDVATRAKLGTVQAHTNRVHDIAFSPDGTLVATSAWSEDGESDVKLWDAASRRHRRVLHGHTDSVFAVAFSPDGKTLATAGFDSTVKLWSVQTGELLNSLAAPHGLVAVAFSPDGKRLAAGGHFHTVRIWDLASSAVLHDFHAHWGMVRCVAFTPDGDSIVTGGMDNTARVWSMPSLPGPFKPEPVGPWPLATFRVSDDWSFSPSFSPKSGELLAAAGFKGGIRFWNLKTFAPMGRCATALPGVAGSGWMADEAAIFTPDERTMIACVSGGKQPKVELWDARQYKLRNTIEVGPVSQGGASAQALMALSPDGTSLAVTCFRPALVSVINLRDGSIRWAGPPPHGAPMSPAFSPDGRTLAVGTNTGVIMLLDASTGQEVREPLEHGSDLVHAVTFSPRGGLLASAGQNNAVVKLWDTTSYESTALPKAHAEKCGSATFSPDGRLLVTTGGMFLEDKAPWTHKGEVCLWDVPTKKLLTKFHAHYGSVTGAAFSPDGKRLATTGRDGTMHLWDVAELLKTPAEKTAK
ncbi:MAG: protein kinase [Thermoguttaceae bacterium]|jgi:WD40 repeat protein/serine/threonine protein kinase|nr:protein kinase [Thermoguttaceae bacterium]